MASLQLAANSAASRWADDVTTVELLAVSENAVFAVDTASGDRFVLRLHRPGYNTIHEMESEQRWVASLHATGVPVPQPRTSLTGDRYESIPIEGAFGADETGVRLAGAIDWVDGVKLADLLEDRPVEEQRTAVPALYHAVGALAARIRIHSTRWEPPDGFARRAWDADGLLGPEPLWGRFWDIPGLEPAQRDILTKARAHLYDLLQSLPVDSSRYGLIHADLHQGNVLFDMAPGEEPSEGIAIDFDDAGFGWFIHELGVALQAAIDEPWAATAREALIDGYRTIHPIDDEELSLLDAFCTIRTLMLIGWLHARPELEAYDRLPTYVAWACSEADEYLEAGVTRRTMHRRWSSSRSGTTKN